MFTFLKRLFQMTLVLVVTIFVAASGIMYWIWNHRDQLTQYQVSLAIHEFAPDWDFRLGAATLTTDGRLILRDFQIKDPMVNTAMLHAPKTELAINWDLYQRTQQIEISKVELQRPVLDVRKLTDGTWTITNLPPIHSAGRKIPPVTIEDGTIRITADDPVIGQTVQYALQNLDLTVNSTDDKFLQIACSADGGQAGKLQFEAAYSLSNNTFLIKGDLDQLQFGNSLVDLVLAMVPDFKPHVDKFHQKLAANPELTQTASLSPWNSDVIEVPKASPENLLKTRLLADLNFTIAKTQADEPLSVQANVDIIEGFIDHPRFPMPLQRLNGSIQVDDEGIRISNMTGFSGQTLMNLAGEFPIQLAALGDSSSPGIRFVSDSHTNGPPTGMIINVSNVQITDRLRETAPKGVQGILNHMNMTGTFDAQSRVRIDETGVHNDLVSLTIIDGTANANSFPYPLTKVHGVVKQDPSAKEETLIYEMTGMAGDRPVTLTGSTKNPGPDHTTLLNISFENLPIDDTFISALPPHVEDLIRKFHIKGRLTAQHQIYFPHGSHQKYQQKSVAHFSNASLNWDLFPYQIDDIQGDVTFDQEVWKFKNVTGRHVNTMLTGEGTIDPHNADYINSFQITAKDGEFDQATHHAVRTAHPEIEKIWKAINPQGKFDATIQIGQHRSRGCEVRIPHFTTENAEITLSFLPYRWENVKSQISFLGDTLQIHSLTAQHATTFVTTKGTLTKTPNFWVARLDELYADNVIPNEELVSALPANIRNVINMLKIKDPMSIRGGVEFKGTYEDINPALTAAWNIVIHVAGMTLDLDTPIERITGKVEMTGIMEPDNIEMHGRLNLDSLFVMGYPITQLSGPFTLNNNQLIFGSSQTFGAQPKGAPKAVALTDRIQGRIFEGIISLDSILTLNEKFDYRTRLEMTRGSLATWSQLNGYGASQIRGNMNGWLDLTGQGNDLNTVAGRGQLWIDQAELYELPLFIRLFNVLKFVPPDKTAFRYAFADFGIANSRFNFEQIEFIGSAIGMSGTGYIRFDKAMSLDFVSKIPRNQSPIPLVNSIMGAPLMSKWTEGIVQVHVGGQVQAPIIETRSGLLFNDSFRRFTQNFNFNSDYQAPRYAPPPTFTPPVPQ